MHPAGSDGLLAALVRARPGLGGLAFPLAVACQLVFSVQTALLDPLVWPAYFSFTS